MAELNFDGFFEQLKKDRNEKAAQKAAQSEELWKLIYSKLDIKSQLMKIGRDEFMYGEMFERAREWLREVCPHCQSVNCVLMGRHPDYDAQFYTCHKCKHTNAIEDAIETGITRHGVEKFADYVHQKGVDD